MKLIQNILIGSLLDVQYVVFDMDYMPHPRRLFGIGIYTRRCVLINMYIRIWATAIVTCMNFCIIIYYHFSVIL